MTFRLDLKHGIDISSDQREIILLSDTGLYHVKDFGKTYLVNGERMSPNSTNGGHKNAYQQTADSCQLKSPNKMKSTIFDCKEKCKKLKKLDKFPVPAFLQFVRYE